MLLRQGEPRCDALVRAEKLPHEIRAITFLAAMQQDDVIRKSACAVQKLANGGEGLELERCPRPPVMRRFKK
jgi:hypothetical protein